MTAVALGLLALTPGFRWRELARGWGRLDWRSVAAVGGVDRGDRGGCWSGGWCRGRRGAAAAGTGLWLTILALYPLLSALPQEMIFRVLFFRRYGRCSRRAGVGGGERASSSRWRTCVLELGGAAR